MKCHSCPSENVASNMRSCTECHKKSILACIEESKKSMEVALKHMNMLEEMFPNCSTAEEDERLKREYKSVGNSYDYSRLNVLYYEHDLGLGGIPRPDKKKSKKTKSMRGLEVQEAY